MVGAGVAAFGIDKVIWEGLLNKVVIPLVVLAHYRFYHILLFMKAAVPAVRRASPKRVGGIFRRLQMVSAAFMAFSHGSNDAQKTMGVITLSLFSAGFPLAVDATACRISHGK